MSSIGKIFTFVNVVLAGLFLGWAARALNENSDWKVKHDDVKSKLEKVVDETKAELTKANASKATTDASLNALRNEKEGVDAELRRTAADLKETKDSLAKWESDLNKLSATHQSVVAANEKLQSEKDKAVLAQHDAEKARDDALAKQLAAETELGARKTDLDKANLTIADLEKDKKSIGQAKSTVETQLASLQAYTNTNLGEIMAMPKIEGRVLAVSMEVQPGLISINKGSADGVKRGFTFQLYDGAKYKGQARVEFVHENSCSAILLNTVKGETPRQGDNATTHL